MLEAVVFEEVLAVVVVVKVVVEVGKKIDSFVPTAAPS